MAVLNKNELIDMLDSPALREVASLQALPKDEAVFVLASGILLDVSQAYHVAFGPGNKGAAVLAASALMNQEMIANAWNDVLRLMLLGESEAKVQLARIARDPAQYPKDRLRALELLMKADGAFDNGGTTYKIKTVTGSPEEAADALVLELKPAKKA